uniref:Uncharacterized protein n=1 Tax=Arundo donax TaxID=35708 RepID=A0A0A9D180_ARUDO
MAHVLYSLFILIRLMTDMNIRKRRNWLIVDKAIS